MKSLDPQYMIIVYTYIESKISTLLLNGKTWISQYDVMTATQLYW